MMRKNKRQVPAIKKDIKDFLLSEEGKIKKGDILKIGTTLAMLCMLFPDTAVAQHTSGPGPHSNAFFSTGHGGHSSSSAAHSSSYYDYSDWGGF